MEPLTLIKHLFHFCWVSRGGRRPENNQQNLLMENNDDLVKVRIQWSEKPHPVDLT